MPPTPLLRARMARCDGRRAFHQSVSAGPKSDNLISGISIVVRARRARPSTGACARARRKKGESFLLSKLGCGRKKKEEVEGKKQLWFSPKKTIRFRLEERSSRRI